MEDRPPEATVSWYCRPCKDYVTARLPNDPSQPPRCPRCGKLKDA